MVLNDEHPVSWSFLKKRMESRLRSFHFKSNNACEAMKTWAVSADFRKNESINSKAFGCMLCAHSSMAIGVLRQMQSKSKMINLMASNVPSDSNVSPDFF